MIMEKRHSSWLLMSMVKFQTFKLYAENLIQSFCLHFLFVKKGTENLMKYLISKGADVNARNAFKRTPLFACATLGKPISVEIKLYFN